MEKSQMTSSKPAQTSTSSLAPLSTVDSSEIAATQQMLNEWLGQRAQAPTQPVQAKRARLLKKLSDLTLKQQPTG